MKANANARLIAPDVSAPCVGCAYPVKPEARFCRRCGTPRASAPVLAPLPGPSDAPRTPDRPTAMASLTRVGRAPVARRRRLGSIGGSGGDRLIPFGGRCPSCRRRLLRRVNFCGSCGAVQPGVSWRRPLRLASREFSARETLVFRQRRAFAALVIVGLVALAGATMATLTVLVGLTIVAYLAVLVYRLRMFATSLRSPDELRIPDEEARAIPDAQLPVYTLLVPAYREPEVIPKLLAELDRLEYPHDRLDVQLLLEADDPATLAAVAAARPGPHVRVVRVPPSEPRTKPKACNVGLAQARGSLVTVYDAEDRPDPLQLRRAVAAFRRVPDDVVCLQAKLSYYNAGQNLITRWFTAEYGMWFSQLLPALVHEGAPVPLGGTSNHFRRAALFDVGGWDAFNVTEDADLGIRLHRLGLRTRVLDSTTLEEANSDVVNWVKQRSRWYKGYLQTWLVHMRHPVALWRELGVRGFVGFNLFLGGTPLLALLNPVFWALTAIWFIAHPTLVAALFPPAIYYAGLVCLTFGNLLFLYGTVVSAHQMRQPSLVLAGVLAPAYWVLMSIAAVKALVQLISMPSFWEKTVHGLDGPPISAPLDAPARAGSDARA